MKTKSYYKMRKGKYIKKMQIICNFGWFILVGFIAKNVRDFWNKS